MPSFIGVLKINANEGNFINGDTLVVSPTSSTKSYSGAGGGINGDFSISNSLFSVTATVDPDIIEAGGNKVATGT
ncbi:putative spore germination protein GerPF [compost metagenome]